VPFGVHYDVELSFRGHSLKTAPKVIVVDISQPTRKNIKVAQILYEKTMIQDGGGCHIEFVYSGKS
jgi:hypothetical protein